MPAMNVVEDRQRISPWHVLALVVPTDQPPKRRRQIEYSSSRMAISMLVEPQSKLEFRQHVLELITENSGGSVSDIGDDVSLHNIGTDSLSVNELKESIEDAFSANFGDWGFGLHSTIKELLDFITPTAV